MNNASGTPFVVTVRRPDGSCQPIDPNTDEHTLVSSVNYMALAMLESAKGREVLAALALKVGEQERARGKGVPGDGSVYFATAEVARYLQGLRASFPPVMIDFAMNDLDALGFTVKFQLEKTRAFDLERSIIAINGARFNDMVAASRTCPLRFRNFQFLFATTLVRKTGGDLFKLSLTQGRFPPRGGDGYDHGLYLEMKLFGGETKYCRDTLQGSEQPGIPYQLDEQGQAWKIDTAIVINAGRYHFDFPFRRAGDPIDPIRLKSMNIA